MSCFFHIGTLLLLFVSWISSIQGLDKPDCSRMVFHPRCRGISAKRSSRTPYFDEADKLYSPDDSTENFNWKNDIDSDIMERIMRNVVYSKMFKNHPKSYYDEDLERR
ncbi:uncharacterized protein [Parasteatoda tepidariorum]|uniref:uncharacterized protein n=1 Tax=Parasteatoda tepidariorum TaxID=114398 RepID=UPI00077FB388|nr:uncharacterized protein LOC107454415 [Parasteatoda tepidariorum]XP_015927095.1 uncharacterized protein LOC107454415 [Parasteatoda tepidariorum]XP_015927096.1 uncharacterized protein LOC107454415 [Parasteatoda tepidariorum]